MKLIVRRMFILVSVIAISAGLISAATGDDSGWEVEKSIDEALRDPVRWRRTVVQPEVYGIGTRIQHLAPGSDASEKYLQTKTVIVHAEISKDDVVRAYIFADNLSEREVTNFQTTVVGDIGGSGICSNFDNLSWPVPIHPLKLYSFFELSISPHYKIMLVGRSDNRFNKDIQRSWFSKAPQSLRGLLSNKYDEEKLFHASCALICAVIYWNTLYIPYIHKAGRDHYGPFAPQFIASAPEYSDIATVLFTSVSRESDLLIQALPQAQLEEMRSLADRLRNENQFEFDGMHKQFADAAQALARFTLLPAKSSSVVVSRDCGVGFAGAGFAGVGECDEVVDLDSVGSESCFSPGSVSSSATVSPERGALDGESCSVEELILDNDQSLRQPLLLKTQGGPVVV